MKQFIEKYKEWLDSTTGRQIQKFVFTIAMIKAGLNILSWLLF